MSNKKIIPLPSASEKEVNILCAKIRSGYELVDKDLENFSVDVDLQKIWFAEVYRIKMHGKNHQNLKPKKNKNQIQEA